MTIASLLAVGALESAAIGGSATAAGILAIAGVARALAHWRESAAKERVAEAGVAKVEARADSQRFLTEHGLAAQLLEAERAEGIRKQQRIDALEHELSMAERSNVGLGLKAEEAEEAKAEHRSCREIVESQNAKINSLEVKLAVCETNHANADARAAWLEARLDKLDGGHERNPSIPAPPRPRSITPSDMPAIKKE